MRTEVGTFSLIRLSIVTSNLETICLFWSKNSFVSFAWRMFASNAELKSREKTWTSLFKDRLISSIIQSIMPSFTIWITVSSLIDIFWRIATQNLWLTDPSSSSCKMSIIFFMMSVLTVVMYSAPLRVETITEIRASKECRTFFLSIWSKLSTNLFLSFV